MGFCYEDLSVKLACFVLFICLFVYEDDYISRCHTQINDLV